MNLRKMIRWQVVLVALAAAMSFSPSAHSQEITNSTFDDGPNVAAFAQSSAAQPSAQQVSVPATSASVREVASTEASLATSQEWVDSPWLSAGLTLLLFTCIALSAIGGSKRAKQNSYAARHYPFYRGA